MRQVFVADFASCIEIKTLIGSKKPGSVETNKSRLRYCLAFGLAAGAIAAGAAGAYGPYYYGYGPGYYGPRYYGPRYYGPAYYGGPYAYYGGPYYRHRYWRRW